MEEYYYDNPSEVDEIAIKATADIISHIKDKAGRDIKSIIEENRRLKEENKQLLDKEKEVLRKEASLQRDYDSLESNFKRKKLKDLEELIITEHFYGIISRHKPQDKCECCDDNRRIEAVDSSGKKHKVPCSCDETIPQATVAIAPFKKLNIYKDLGSSNIGLEVCYVKADDVGRDCISFEYVNARNVLDKFTEECKQMNTYRIAYRTEEEAQKHCDWLNNKHKQTV